MGVRRLLRRMLPWLMNRLSRWAAADRWSGDRGTTIAGRATARSHEPG